MKTFLTKDCFKHFYKKQRNQKVKCKTAQASHNTSIAKAQTFHLQQATTTCTSTCFFQGKKNEKETYTYT